MMFRLQVLFVIWMANVCSTFVSEKSESSFWNIEVPANNYTTHVLDPNDNEILRVTKAELSVNGPLSDQPIWARVMVNVSCNWYHDSETWIAGNSQIC